MLLRERLKFSAPGERGEIVRAAIPLHYQHMLSIKDRPHMLEYCHPSRLGLSLLHPEEGELGIKGQTRCVPCLT